MLHGLMAHIHEKIIGKFRARYVPLLMVYFAYGASGIAGIAVSFWEKNELAIPAEGLITIGIWASIPWTIKMVFGQFADSIRIFGAGRRIYIFMGAGLVALGQTIMINLAARTEWLLALGNIGNLYLVSAVITAIGFVLQDVIADTMSTEVVERTNPDGSPRDEAEIGKDLKHVQWFGRLALMLGVILTSYLAGWLAANYTYKTVFTIALAIPAVSVMGAIFVKLNPVPRTPVNWWILGGGLAFGAFALNLAAFEIPYGQEIIFFVSLAVICFLLNRLGITKSLVFAAIAIFLFRATPGVGPGASWWMIDTLGFDEEFMGRLAQISSIVGLLGLFAFRKYITEKPIRFTLLWLTILGSLLALPTIGLYYGAHEWLGVEARTVALVDTAVSAPLGQLSMVPLLALIAASCPAGKAGTWFALMSSLMNLALNASALGTRYLNKIYLVTREVRDAGGNIVTQANYDALGIMFLMSWVIGLLLPLAAILIFLRNGKDAS